MSRFVYDGVKYGLIGAVGIYEDDRRILSYHWIEADTIAIVSPCPSVGFSEDEFVRCPLSIFKF